MYELWIPARDYRQAVQWCEDNQVEFEPFRPMKRSLVENNRFWDDDMNLPLKIADKYNAMKVALHWGEMK